MPQTKQLSLPTSNPNINYLLDWASLFFVKECGIINEYMQESSTKVFAKRAYGRCKPF